MGTAADVTRDVLISIRPFYASKILSGEKTVELRRKFPEAGSIGATVLIYSSAPVSAVVGCALIERVVKLPVPDIWAQHSAAACITKKVFDEYFFGLTHGYAIFIGRVHPFEKQLRAVELEAIWDCAASIVSVHYRRMRRIAER